ncbi:Epididymal-specific lipocalin-9 [Manis javanica]|nr:Epididymal-specific lipocalin-9 [Manis javanica]
MNEECQKEVAVGIRAENDFCNTDYEGKNRFQFKFTDSNFLVTYAENTDADGKKTRITELLGRTRETNENAYKEFKQATEEEGIPTESTQNVINTDQEPTSGNHQPWTLGINLFAISGDWYTGLRAADDVNMIRENGPLRIYVRRLQCSDICKTINADYYSKVNGTCQSHTLALRKTENGIYEADFQDGKKTVFTELLVKRRDVSKEGYEEFKVFTESKGIRAENILEVIKEDTCPLTIG